MPALCGGPCPHFAARQDTAARRRHGQGRSRGHGRGPRHNQARHIRQDVEIAWRKVIARHGLKKESRIGYSIGVAYPPDWGEHTISLRPGDKSVLEPGNVVHCILGMWMESWGIEVSETILVTDKGNETLTKYPREIHVKS